MLNAEAPTDVLPPTANGAPGEAFADVARCFRQIGEEAGADDFSLFLVSPADCGRLTPFMDASHPQISKKTELLALTLGDRFALRMSGTTQPCWWAEGNDSRTAASLARCLWAERITAPQGMGPALALSLVDERDQAGAIVLSGDRIELSMPALADIQARCLTLFSRMTGLRKAAPGIAPSISRRELECLVLTANGQTSEEIAARLGLSVHTANQYLTNSTHKLNAVNRMHAVAKAMRMGLID
jgi:DNA-binding CsgD family transcriptional regulator